MNALVVPSHIGKYEVLHLLGSGGMGRVYLALDPDIGRKVAIKQVTLSADSEARARFVREAQAMGRINHPNIITLLEYGVDGDSPFLVLELLSGVDLSVWAKAPHTLREYLQVMLDIAQAIDAAHKAGVLHRDLKLDNVRVLDDGRCKLLDFGIAQTGLAQLTALGYFVGTPEFVAPEVICGLPHSKAADIYALGLLYYVLLTGDNPFRADTVEATVARIVQVLPAPLSESVKNVPKPVQEIIAACLSKKPEARPASAATIVEQLQKSLAGCDPQARILRVRSPQTTPTESLSPPTRVQSVEKASKKSVPKRGLLTAGLIILGSVVAFIFWREQANLNTPISQAPIESPVLATPRSDAPAKNDDATLPIANAPVSALPGVAAPSVAAPGVATTDVASGTLPETTAAAPVLSEKHVPSDQPEAVATALPLPHLVDTPVTKAPTKTPAKQEIPKPPTPVAIATLPSEIPAKASVAVPVGQIRPDDSAGPPVAASPTASPTTTSAPESVKLEISRYGPRALKSGRTATLRIDGVGVDRVDKASVLLGGAIDTRFRIGPIQHVSQSILELNISVARGVPFGSYVLVLDGAGMFSKSISIEVSL